MVKKREEEQKVFREPIKVILGGREYEVRPLVLRDSRKWRKDVVVAISDSTQYASVDVKDSVQFKEVINQTLALSPDAVIDLFFGYAKDLDREEIEGKATDEEIDKAFGQVMELGFPLAQSLVRAMVKISQ